MTTPSANNSQPQQLGMQDIKLIGEIKEEKGGQFSAIGSINGRSVSIILNPKQGASAQSIKNDMMNTLEKTAILMETKGLGTTYSSVSFGEKGMALQNNKGQSFRVSDFSQEITALRNKIIANPKDQASKTKLQKLEYYTTVLNGAGASSTVSPIPQRPAALSNKAPRPEPPNIPVPPRPAPKSTSPSRPTAPPPIAPKYQGATSKEPPVYKGADGTAKPPQFVGRRPQSKQMGPLPPPPKLIVPQTREPQKQADATIQSSQNKKTPPPPFPPRRNTEKQENRGTLTPGSRPLPPPPRQAQGSRQSPTPEQIGSTETYRSQIGSRGGAIDRAPGRSPPSRPLPSVPKQKQSTMDEVKEAPKKPTSETTQQLKEKLLTIVKNKEKVDRRTQIVKFGSVFDGINNKLNANPKPTGKELAALNKLKASVYNQIIKNEKKMPPLEMIKTLQDISTSAFGTVLFREYEEEVHNRYKMVTDRIYEYEKNHKSSSRHKESIKVINESMKELSNIRRNVVKEGFKKFYSDKTSYSNEGWDYRIQDDYSKEMLSPSQKATLEQSKEKLEGLLSQVNEAEKRLDKKTNSTLHQAFVIYAQAHIEGQLKEINFLLGNIDRATYRK